jgi:hypothetical protein
VGGGDFYAEPKPQVTLRMPSWRWHLGKVLFRKIVAVQQALTSGRVLHQAFAAAR